MSNAILKKFLKSLSKLLITTFSLSLVAGLISPVMTVAAPAYNPKLDSAPVNLTVVKSTNYAGDSKTPTVQVKRSTGVTFPSIPSGDYYYAHLYNLDTGKHVSSEEITPSSTMQVWGATTFEHWTRERTTGKIC